VIPVYSTLIESGARDSNEREPMDLEGTGRVIHRKSICALLELYYCTR